MLDDDRNVALDGVRVRHAARQLDASELSRVVEAHVPCAPGAELELDGAERLAVFEEEHEANHRLVRRVLSRHEDSWLGAAGEEAAGR